MLTDKQALESERKAVKEQKSGVFLVGYLIIATPLFMYGLYLILDKIGLIEGLKKNP